MLSISDMELYKSERGADVCLYNQFEYTVKRKKDDGTVQWRCREEKQSKCRATLHTKGNGILKDTIQKLLILNHDMGCGPRQNRKYQRLAERLSDKVTTYFNQPDKLKYLRTVAYMA